MEPRNFANWLFDASAILVAVVAAELVVAYLQARVPALAVPQQGK